MYPRNVNRDRVWSILRHCALSSLVWSFASAASGKQAADYFVHSLPGQPGGPLLKMHAGHIEVTPESNGNLFFWHYQNRHMPDKPRTVIWLNGGPGCSSMDGALMEIGPYRVREEGKLEYNNGSWDEFANVLFVDNPVGTGFSYVDTNKYVHELTTMADNMVTFLEKFMGLFPEYMHDDIYIAGESYAGQHIPFIADAMLKRNDKLENSNETWHLSGLLIGNGWISPEDQYPAYLKFAYEEKLLEKGSANAREVEKRQKQCTDMLDAGDGDRVDTSICEEILQDILRESRDKSAKEDQRCYNMYDVRLRDSYSSCGMSWPPDLKTVTPYLRRDDVRRALNVDKQKQAAWTECNGAVGSAFTPKSAPSIHLLPDLLSKIPILLFSGNKDLICNHIGTESLIHKLDWNNGTGFETSPGTWAPRQSWSFEGEAAGFYQSARNLTYVLFYNSSHMVPFDYPRRTRDMFDRFIGVTIDGIGGTPGDSRIDGVKAGPETSVEANPASDKAAVETDKKVKQAESHAYYKSGEAVLLLVVVAAGIWGWWVWRARRSRRRMGYAGVSTAEGGDGQGVFGSVRDAVMEPHLDRAWRVKEGRDLEAADFDENELDDLSGRGGVRKRRGSGALGGYELGGDSESERGSEDGVEGKRFHDKDGAPLANSHGRGRGDGEKDGLVGAGNGHA